MTQLELSQRMGRPAKTINEIINGKTAITPETALQLERVLGVPAHFWRNREEQYQQYLWRRRTKQSWPNAAIGSKKYLSGILRSVAG